MRSPNLSLGLALLGLGLLVQPAHAQKKQRDLITAEEIAKNPAADAYQLVQSLRPAWFRTRGAASASVSADAMGNATVPGGIVVYVDGIKVGGVEELKNVSSDRVLELRFVNASDATTKYGTGHTAGAIEVTTRKR
jgi:hypothetical protein